MHSLLRLTTSVILLIGGAAALCWLQPALLGEMGLDVTVWCADLHYLREQQQRQLAIEETCEQSAREASRKAEVVAALCAGQISFAAAEAELRGLCDVQTVLARFAWEKFPTTVPERRWLYIVHHWGLMQAVYQSTAEQEASKARLDSGLAECLRSLNG